MSKTLVREQRHPFYPMIIFCFHERLDEDGKVHVVSRSIRRDTRWDERWGFHGMHVLFGRQIGKLAARKRKPLMELPYTTSFECDGCDSESPLAYRCLGEAEKFKHEPKPVKKTAPLAVPSGEQILDAEMEEV